MSKYVVPTLFEGVPNLVAAMSLRVEGLPADFSMLPTNTNEEVAANNRAQMASDLGFDNGHLVVARLKHGKDVAEITTKLDDRPEVDGLITQGPGHVIAVGVADCVAVLLYDPATQAMGVIHSGWRGSEVNVSAEVVSQMRERYGAKPASMLAYLSPAPHQNEYETSDEIAAAFDASYSRPSRAGHAWLDNQAVVRDQLLACGILPEHMEIDSRSTIADPSLHSYRRDGKASGRMLAVIGLTS